MRNNAAVGTKLCAMHKRMLTSEDFSKLIRFKSVNEIYEFLKKKEGYGKILSSSSGGVHRENIEAVLTNTIISDLESIIHFLKDDDKKIMKFYFTEMEIEKLKSILRRIGAGTDFEVSKDFSGSKLGFDIKKVSEAKTIKEFIVALSGSVYQKPLLKLLSDTGHQTVFDAEMNLDMFYVTKHIDFLKNIKGAEEILEFSMISADITNLLWILRCKKYYSVADEVIYSFMINRFYKVSPGYLRSLVEAENSDETEGLLKNGPYGMIFSNSDDIRPELKARRYFIKETEKVFKKERNSVTGAAAYIRLKMYELIDLTSVIECVRYSVGAEETKKHLIRGVN